MADLVALPVGFAPALVFAGDQGAARGDGAPPGGAFFAESAGVGGASQSAADDGDNHLCGQGPVHCSSLRGCYCSGNLLAPKRFR